MQGAILILLFTVCTGIILYVLDLRQRRENAKASISSSGDTDANALPQERSASGDDSSVAEVKEGECCGLHLVCEKELDAVANDKVLYYDDEELDRYIGRKPDEYNAEEIEEFRDVLLTLLPEDVPGWARSLDRRHIQPPQEVRDELILMLQDLI